MTTLKQEFVNAAKETPRMFFAPLIGAARAIAREFEVLGKKATKKAEMEGEYRIVVVNRSSMRRMRNAAKRVKHESAVRAQDTQEPQQTKC
ncbi:shikimate 5-dehydrogenase [Pseudomonas frederiksbergensis]|jgi:shikimate 5-dehydrogenase|uniref:hypothetical protein n=1 Tax=Pseudomonas frederiksbergensis TaxID=104087 RepID=UPI003D19E465